MAFCPHLVVPAPEVKPIKPNLLAHAGMLHRSGDRGPQDGTPSRLVLGDVPESELGGRGGLVHPPDVLSWGGDCWMSLG